MRLQDLRETWCRQWCLSGYVDCFSAEAMGGGQLRSEEEVEEELRLSASTVHESSGEFG